jgi:hypothetical protein
VAALGSNSVRGEDRDDHLSGGGADAMPKTKHQQPETTFRPSGRSSEDLQILPATDSVRVVESLEIPSAYELLTFPVDLFCSEEADPILPGSFLAKAPKNQCL